MNMVTEQRLSTVILLIYLIIQFTHSIYGQNAEPLILLSEKNFTLLLNGDDKAVKQMLLRNGSKPLFIIETLPLFSTKIRSNISDESLSEEIKPGHEKLDLHYYKRQKAEPRLTKQNEKSGSVINLNHYKDSRGAESIPQIIAVTDYEPKKIKTPEIVTKASRTYSAKEFIDSSSSLPEGVKNTVSTMSNIYYEVPRQRNFVKKSIYDKNEDISEMLPQNYPLKEFTHKHSLKDDDLKRSSRLKPRSSEMSDSKHHEHHVKSSPHHLQIVHLSPKRMEGFRSFQVMSPNILQQASTESTVHSFRKTIPLQQSSDHSELFNRLPYHYEINASHERTGIKMKPSPRIPNSVGDDTSLVNNAFTNVQESPIDSNVKGSNNNKHFVNKLQGQSSAGHNVFNGNNEKGLNTYSALESLLKYDIMPRPFSMPYEKTKTEFDESEVHKSKHYNKLPNNLSHVDSIADIDMFKHNKKRTRQDAFQSTYKPILTTHSSVEYVKNNEDTLPQSKVLLPVYFHNREQEKNYQGYNIKDSSTHSTIENPHTSNQSKEDDLKHTVRENSQISGENVNKNWNNTPKYKNNIDNEKESGRDRHTEYDQQSVNDYKENIYRENNHGENERRANSSLDYDYVGDDNIHEQSERKNYNEAVNDHHGKSKNQDDDQEQENTNEHVQNDHLQSDKHERKDENKRYEEGHKEKHGEGHYEEHNEDSDEKYENSHEHENAEKGHHDKESHDHHYDEEDGEEKKHEDESDYHEEHHHGEDAEKAAMFKESGEHQKGHSTKGHHSTHKKDEYEKKTEFFDEFDEEDGLEKEGEYHHEREDEKGGHHKFDHYHGEHDEEKHGEKQKYEKGHHHHEGVGGKKTKGHHRHHHYEQNHGEKGERENEKHWKYKKGNNGEQLKKEKE